jgi:prolyl oligopeptidase
MSSHTYPPAARLDLVEDLHGHKVADPYRWLEDPTAEDSVAWTRAQDALLAQERDQWLGRAQVGRHAASSSVAAGLLTTC